MYRYRHQLFAVTKLISRSRHQRQRTPKQCLDINTVVIYDHDVYSNVICPMDMEYLMANTDDALKFQENELNKLKGFSYSELDELKGRKEIPSPPNLANFSFAREIKNDEFGGLEVNVFHYFYLTPEQQEEVRRISGSLSDEVSIGESKMCRWFNINRSGDIEWPDMEFQDGED